MIGWRSFLFAMFGALGLGSAVAQAQVVSRSVGAQAIGVLTHATPALHGESLTEGYLTQPVIMEQVGFGGGRVLLLGTLNLEGLTLERGELNAGVWGEGYVDRRHPHTYLHEVMAVARVVDGAERVGEFSLAIGKGFAPFGTDDPMARPFVKYPANHHLAQVLERLVGIAALRAGRVIIEVGIFNGDEPGEPTDFASVDRFGDSWAARTTLLPLPSLEIAGSYAFVASPEFAAGSGLDHRKWSAALRYEATGPSDSRRYALLEWAQTNEYSGPLRRFSFHSVLLEGALRRQGTELAIRLERTVRPEEERLIDPFRSPRPHTDANILGATRWESVTARLSRALALSSHFRVEPFVEVARLRARETLRPSVFVPAEFYGSERMWSLSAGVQLAAGLRHPRMGRYGAADPVRELEPPRHWH